MLRAAYCTPATFSAWLSRSGMLLLLGRPPGAAASASSSTAACRRLSYRLLRTSQAAWALDTLQVCRPARQQGCWSTCFSPHYADECFFAFAPAFLVQYMHAALCDGSCVRGTPRSVALHMWTHSNGVCPHMPAYLLNGSRGSSCAALSLSSLLRCLAVSRTAASISGPLGPNSVARLGGRVRSPLCEWQ